VTTSLADFREKPYEDARWEIISEIENPNDFMPLRLEKVDSPESVDQTGFFPDYGGRVEGKKLWHNPQCAVVEKEEEIIPKVSLTEEELQAKLEEAREQGFKSAEAQAKERFDAQLEQMKQSLISLFQDMKSQIDNHYQLIEEQAVKLSVQIAKKLVTAVVEFNPEYIVHVVKEALSHVKTASISEVRVSPQDLEFIEVLGFKNQRDFEGINFIADETIRAGCIIETSAGQIDYDLDSSFARIQELVVKV
jgi:flagellar biosynthesis/type III secretory pathway protein FliH